jgi:hypothetical protein
MTAAFSYVKCGRPTRLLTAPSLDRRLPAGSPMIAAVAAAPVRNIRCSFRGPQLLAGRLRLLVRSLLAERVFYLTPTAIN